MKKTIFLCLFALITIFTVSCNREDDRDKVTTVFASVHHKHVDYAIPPDFYVVKGLKIKKSDAAEWITIVGIDEFAFEENFEYRVKLEQTVMANPPMDSPSDTTYRLLEVLSKEPK